MGTRDPQVVVVLHPGEMGASVGAALVGTGHEVRWVAGGRSDETRRRAEEAGLVAVPDLAAALDGAGFVVSVCPPGAAREVAGAVARARYDGCYLDANAIAPASSRAVGMAVRAAGASFVDGGIIGPPARQPGTTRCYLAGPEAPAVAERFVGSALDARVVGEEPGRASALKAAYAAWTKGSAALLLLARALARAEGVEEDLVDEWAISQAGLDEQSRATAALTAPKAWRFVEEMEEIAAAAAAHSLPDGFHRAAAEVDRVLVRFRDADAPVLDAVLDALLQRDKYI